MNTCIEVKDSTKTFNGRVVVDKITFRVEKGAGLENVWKIALLLAGITVICSVISVKVFRWE